MDKSIWLRLLCLCSMLLITTLFLMQLTYNATGYVDTRISHDTSIFAASSDELSCRFCHIGQPNYWPVEDDYLLVGYRCIACHYEVSPDVVVSLFNSTHKLLMCNDCHDVFHVGHKSGYQDRGVGYYGCKCHEIYSEKLYPPSNTASYFAYITMLNEVATKGHLISSDLYFFASQPGGLGIYTSSYIDPLDVDWEVPSQSKLYHECLSCHNMAFNEPKNNTPIHYYVIHSDNCYYCHAINLTYPLPPHSIASSQNAWILCRRCHEEVYYNVSHSIHVRLGCRCHPILHEAGWNRTAAWLVIYYPEGGAISVPSVPTNFSSWKHVLFFDPLNASAYSIPLGPLSYGTDYTYFTMFYADRYGDASYFTNTTKYLICFNCHFVVDSAAARVKKVKGLIPIPKSVFENITDPHTIKPLQLKAGAEGLSSAPKTGEGGGLPLLLVATAIAVTVMVYMFHVVQRNQLMSR